jgi:hypothetical protein
MSLPAVTQNTEVWIGFGLFVLSEAIGMSKSKDNSVLQLVLHMASELFPYEVQRRDPATRGNRPKRKRDERGRFTD